MSTIRTNAILDSAGGNTATINGITPALASQAQAEAGTDNTTLMTPLRVMQAIAVEAIGIGQTWQNLTGSRALGTAYQNTTGRPIMIAVAAGGSQMSEMQVSADNVTYVSAGNTSGFGGASDVKSASTIVPNNYYYRVLTSAGTVLNYWSELR